MGANSSDQVYNRYYVFSHVAGESVKYLMGNDLISWSVNFEDAHFFQYEKVAKTRVDWLATREASDVLGNRNFVVGRVKVQVDELYAMLVGGQ